MRKVIVTIMILLLILGLPNMARATSGDPVFATSKDDNCSLKEIYNAVVTQGGRWLDSEIPDGNRVWTGAGTGVNGHSMNFEPNSVCLGHSRDSVIAGKQYHADIIDINGNEYKFNGKPISNRVVLDDGTKEGRTVNMNFQYLGFAAYWATLKKETCDNGGGDSYGYGEVSSVSMFVTPAKSAMRHWIGTKIPALEQAVYGTLSVRYMDLPKTDSDGHLFSHKGLDDAQRWTYKQLGETTILDYDTALKEYINSRENSKISLDTDKMEEVKKEGKLYASYRKINNKTYTQIGPYYFTSQRRKTNESSDGK